MDGGWEYGAGAGLLKRSLPIFSKIIILTFRNYSILRKIVLWIWKCIMFFSHHNFMKKAILCWLKMKLKISHILRWFIFVKRFKELEIDFWQKTIGELVKLPFWKCSKNKGRIVNIQKCLIWYICNNFFLLSFKKFL